MGHSSDQRFPLNAKCVFKGVIFDVWQWEQAMFDGSTETFEKLARRDTAAIVPILPDGRIMLLHQEQPDRPPYTGLPAGRLDDGETPEECVRRELLEETGYAAKEVVPWFIDAPYTKIAWNVHFFIGRRCEKTAEPIDDPGERAKPFFVDFDEFLEAVTAPSFRDKEVTLRTLRDRLEPQKVADLRSTFFGT